MVQPHEVIYGVSCHLSCLGCHLDYTADSTQQLTQRLWPERAVVPVKVCDADRDLCVLLFTLCSVERRVFVVI